MDDYGPTQQPTFIFPLRKEYERAYNTLEGLMESGKHEEYGEYLGIFRQGVLEAQTLAATG